MRSIWTLKRRYDEAEAEAELCSAYRVTERPVLSRVSAEKINYKVVLHAYAHEPSDFVGVARWTLGASYIR